MYRFSSRRKPRFPIFLIYNLKNIYEKITIQGKESTIEAALREKCKDGNRPLITEISQFNRGAVHLITKIGDKESVENLVEELIADNLSKLKPEEKKLVTLYTANPIRTTRDTNVPTTFVSYKNILQQSLRKKVPSIPDTSRTYTTVASTADSTIGGTSTDKLEE